VLANEMKTLLACGLIVIGMITANAQKVKVAADRTVDLVKYKTYSWAPGQATANPIIHETIVEAVDGALSAKGLRKVENNADMVVVAWAAVDTDIHITYPGWHPQSNSIHTGIVVGTSTWPVSKGTLVVDIDDAATKASVWRATAVETLDQGPTGSPTKDAKSVEKKIKKAVEKMFKKFPRA
jgi:Domain of unknown function (DUF4136)